MSFLTRQTPLLPNGTSIGLELEKRAWESTTSFCIYWHLLWNLWLILMIIHKHETSIASDKGSIYVCWIWFIYDLIQFFGLLSFLSKIFTERWDRWNFSPLHSLNKASYLQSFWFTYLAAPLVGTCKFEIVNIYSETVFLRMRYVCACFVLFTSNSEIAHGPWSDFFFSYICICLQFLFIST